MIVERSWVCCGKFGLHQSNKNLSSLQKCNCLGRIYKFLVQNLLKTTFFGEILKLIWEKTTFNDFLGSNLTRQYYILFPIPFLSPFMDLYQTSSAFLIFLKSYLSRHLFYILESILIGFETWTLSWQIFLTNF